MKTYEEILKAKIDYYGRTEAAYQFAAEEFSNMNVTEQLRLHRVSHHRELLFDFMEWHNEDAEKTPVTNYEIDLFIKEKLSN